MSIVRPEDLIVSEIIGDMEIACDYSDHRTCGKGPAEWALHRVRCSCGNGGVALACTKCKDDRLLGDFFVTCGECGVAYHVREAYTYIEPISRPR